MKTIETALKEVNIQNLGNIIKEAKNEPTDLKNDIITPLHATNLSTLADKRKELYENLKKTDEDILNKANLKDKSGIFHALKQNAELKRKEKENEINHNENLKQGVLNSLLKNKKRNNYLIEIIY